MNKLLIVIAIVSLTSCFSPNGEAPETPVQDSINLDSLKRSLDSIPDSLAVDQIFEND